MKYLITESQSNLINLEKKSDLLYELLEMDYPDNYEYETSNNETEVYENEDNTNLLFYYKWDEKEFYIGVPVVEGFFKITQLPFLNVELLMTTKSKERSEFNEVIKIFAKRHYGWDVNEVWFHWY